MKKILTGVLLLGSFSVMAQDYYSLIIKLAQIMAVPEGLIDKVCLVQVVNKDSETSHELYLGSGIAKSECENRSTTMQNVLLNYTEAHALLFTYQELKSPIQYALVNSNNLKEVKVTLNTEYDAGYSEGYLEGYGFNTSRIERQFEKSSF